MKIVMISGSWPPMRCGVGDYSSVLCVHLSKEGFDIVPLRRENWSLTSLVDYRNSLVNLRPDLIHIQYPSVGYGRSLLPAITGYLVSDTPIIVTLHEFEIFKFYRWLWFYPYSRKASARIFSRSAERMAFANRFGTDHINDFVVPIGSNIPIATDVVKNPESVAFFGLFWPGKGVEEFLQFAELLRAEKRTTKLTILGAPMKSQVSFAAKIRSACTRLNIELVENQPAELVARKLAECEFAYLPFPDGADERRGTLAAALVNGCVVLTTHASDTPDWLRHATIHANTPNDAIALLKGDLQNMEFRKKMNERTKEAAQNYDWKNIAKQHKHIYEKIVGKRS